MNVRPDLAGYLGKRIVIGLRPEDLEDARIVPESPADRRFSTEVRLIEALGAEVLVHFTLDAEPYSIMDKEFEGEDAEALETADGKSVYVGRFSPRSMVKLGETVEIAVDTVRMHFFDAESGLAIWG